MAQELEAVYATDKDSVTGLYYPKSEADKVLLHHARKRCLAMRHYCASRFSEWCTERRKKADFYWKWKEIWLSLAAKPTWDRFLQLIHKEE